MKKIPLLIWKCLCVILPFILFSVYASGNFLAYADEESPYYSWNKEFTHTEQEKKYDVVILGDSVANASYVPELLSDTTVNLALGGMTPVENYYIFRDWLEHNEAPEHVFISFQDLHMNMSDCFWSRAMYMHRFDFKDNVEILKKAAAYGEETIAVDGWAGDLIEYELYLPTKYITSMTKASFNQRLEKNTSRKGKTDLHRGWYMGRSIVEHTDTEPQSYSEYVVDPIYDEYYHGILDLCEKHNISVHIIRLPLSDMTTFTDTYDDQLYAYYEGLCREYSDVSFDWYAQVYEKEMFMDYVHMNMHGALKFSRFLKEEWKDCFNDTYSSGQIRAINDNLYEENTFSGWFGWIAGKDYTMLICDETGKALEELAPAAAEYGLSLKPYAQDGAPGQMYVVSGTNKGGAEDITLDISGEEWKVSVAKKEPVSWYRLQEKGMSVVIVDHYHDEIAVQRNFVYEHNFVAK